MNPTTAITFLIKPYENRSTRLRVHVFETFGAMRAWGRETGSTGANWYAMFRPYTRRLYYGNGTRARTRPEWGEILITRRHVDHPAVLPHECIHAAIEWCRRRRYDMDLSSACNESGVYVQQQSTEESICLLAGRLVQSIVNRWAKENRRSRRAKG